MKLFRRLFRRKSERTQIKGDNVSFTPAKSALSPQSRYEVAKQSVALIRADISDLRSKPYLYEVERQFDLHELNEALALAEAEFDTAERALLAVEKERAI